MATRPFKDKHPTIGNNVYIDPTAVVIGDVNIGEDVSIWVAYAAFFSRSAFH